MGICPTRYEIPAGETGDGQVGSKKVHYGCAAFQGRRDHMEDYVGARYARLQSSGRREFAYFAIFDGHGGSRVAQYCTENLFDIVIKHIPKVNNIDEVTDEDLTDVITDAIMETDQRIGNLPPVLTVIMPFLPCLDPMEQLKDIEFMGSTASMVFMTPDRLVFANVGDSRGLLIRNNEVFFSTLDHSPDEVVESLRIEAAGYLVEGGRVDGILAVARALGDTRFKQNEELSPELQAVSAKPDVTIVARSPSDQYLVIASDGVWNCVHNEEMLEFVKQHLVNDGMGLEPFCRWVLDECINARLGSDNMSIIVVDLTSNSAHQESSARPSAKVANAGTVSTELAMPGESSPLAEEQVMTRELPTSDSAQVHKVEDEEKAESLHQEPSPRDTAGLEHPHSQAKPEDELHIPVHRD